MVPHSFLIKLNVLMIANFIGIIAFQIDINRYNIVVAKENPFNGKYSKEIFQVHILL
jgi:hypothetical protein